MDLLDRHLARGVAARATTTPPEPEPTRRCGRYFDASVKVLPPSVARQPVVHANRLGLQLAVFHGTREIERDRDRTRRSQKLRRAPTLSPRIHAPRLNSRPAYPSQCPRTPLLVPSLAVAPGAPRFRRRPPSCAACSSRRPPRAATSTRRAPTRWWRSSRRRACPSTRALLGATDAVPSGLWRASYTAGAPPPRWERNARRLGFFRNRAGQAYDATTGRVANYGEVAGPSVYFTACGSFTERDASVARYPKDYDVAIEEGGRALRSAIPELGDLGPRLPPRPLPRRGPPNIRVADRPPDTGRDVTGEKGVWESAGLKVVQVREAAFER